MADGSLILAFGLTLLFVNLFSFVIAQNEGKIEPITFRFQELFLNQYYTPKGGRPPKIG